MAIAGLSILAATAAATAPAYPVAEVLAAFYETCGSYGAPADYSSQDYYGEQVKPQIAAWRRIATQAGWQSVPSGPQVSATIALDSKMIGRMRMLDYTLAVRMGGDAPEDTALFRKTVAGRPLYLSLFGGQPPGNTREAAQALIECRLHDPMTEGFTASPIDETTLARWAGAKVETTEKSFGARMFSFKNKHTHKRDGFDLHVGTRYSTNIGSYGIWDTNFDFYAPYGITLVAAAIPSQTIIVTQ